jgi:hypothetical protein
MTSNKFSNFPGRGFDRNYNSDLKSQVIKLIPPLLPVWGKNEFPLLVERAVSLIGSGHWLK